PLARSNECPGALDRKRRVDVPAARLAPDERELEVVRVALLDEDRVGRLHTVDLTVLHQQHGPRCSHVDKAGLRLAECLRPRVEEGCFTGDGYRLALLDGIGGEVDVR